MEKRQIGRNFGYDLKSDLKAIEEEGRRSIQAKKREVTEKASKDLLFEQERIAQTVQALYEAVYQNPNKATAELLMDSVSNHPQGPFSQEVAENFASAIESYRKKREVVQKFIGDNNRDPKLMFEKCFGVAPKGKVEAISGPMTLSFRCFDDQDYFSAYTHGVRDADGSKDEALGKAKESGGTAFYSVNVPELVGCVIAERVASNFEDRIIYNKQRVEITGKQKNSWQRFEYPKASGSNPIHFDLPEIGRVEARLLRGTKAQIVGVILTTAEGRRHLGSLGISEADKRLKIPIPTKPFASEEWVELEFTEESFAIFDHTKAGVSFETAEYAGSEKVVRDKNISKQIRRHEEQHQFNKLFEPSTGTFNAPYFEFRRLKYYAQNHPEKNITALVAKKFAELYRRTFIDNRVRDEILAYTKDGRDPNEIYTTLAKSQLYNFKDQSFIRFKGENITYGDVIHKKVLELTSKLIENGESTFGLGSSTHVAELGIKKVWEKGVDDQIAAKEVEKVLGSEYSIKTLYRWTSLVKNMKDAGYTNLEIVSFLGMLPINRWHSSVRRLLKHYRLRPIDKLAETKQYTKKDAMGIVE